jgi:uncharacterized protein
VAKWLTRSVAARVFGGSIPSLRFFDMRVIIIHGWGGNPNEGWFPWIRKELGRKGFSVEIPEMPETDYPKIEAWVGKLKEMKPDENTVLIGHSIECQTILRFLESGNNVKGVILVAGWMKLKEDSFQDEGEIEIAEPWEKTNIDFSAVKEKAGKVFTIYSTNDPFVRLEDQEMFNTELDAELINVGEKGHISGDNGIMELPEVLDAVEKI